jgi:hypothetical protein
MKITFCEKKSTSHKVQESHFWVVHFEKQFASITALNLTTSLHSEPLISMMKRSKQQGFLAFPLVFHEKIHLSSSNKQALSSFKILVLSLIFVTLVILAQAGNMAKFKQACILLPLCSTRNICTSGDRKKMVISLFLYRNQIIL